MGRKIAYANKALVPPSIKTGTLEFQSALLRLASTAMVGTYEKDASRSPTVRSRPQFDPYVANGLPLK